MGNATWAAPFLLLVPLAGCVGSEPSDSLEVTGPANPLDPAATLPVELPAEADQEEHSMTLFLTADRKLSLARPSSGTQVPEALGFSDPEFMLGSKKLQPWALDRSLPQGMRILSARFEVWFSTGAPQASWTQQVGFFNNVLLWWGEDARWSTTVAWESPNQLTAGQVVHIEGDLEVPPGGLIYEKGTFPAILLAFGYLQHGANPILVHVGGDHASALTVAASPYEFPPTSRPKETQSEHTWGPYTFFLPSSPGGETTKKIPLTVTAQTAKVHIDLEGRATAGPLDLDLAVDDPSGKRIWSSTTPHAREGIKLYAENWVAGPGEYQIVVTNFHAPTGGQHTLVVREYSKEPAEA